MAKQTNEKKVQAEITVHIFKSVFKGDAQRPKIKPKYDATHIRDACVESFHCLVSPAVQHLSGSNCCNCALKLEIKACLNVNKL